MKFNFAPYQLFFPLGVLNALLAVGVWFVADLNWLSTPAMLIHPRLIMGGFLFCFITGFLMTALPRMTGTRSATKLEYLVSLGLMMGLMSTSWIMNSRPFYLLHIFLISFLLIFALRRLPNLQKPVPVFFSHIALALITAIIGAAFYYRYNTMMGLHLFHVGPVLLLILGIGTRFFSFLSGLPSKFENDSSKVHRWIFHFCGLLTVIFLYLAGQGKTWAYLCLSILMLFYLVSIWSVFRPSTRPTPLKWSMRIVALSMPLSFLMCWFQPLMFVAWLHFLFIGCFGMITFSVATRVILAHGSYPLDLEMRSKSLGLTVLFLVMGIMTRISYSMVENLMFKKSLLHLAATFWVLAIIAWSTIYLFKVFKDGPQAKPSC